MGGAGKRLLEFMEFQQQQLEGGLWLSCSQLAAWY